MKIIVVLQIKCVCKVINNGLKILCNKLFSMIGSFSIHINSLKQLFLDLTKLKITISN